MNLQLIEDTIRALDIALPEIGKAIMRIYNDMEHAEIQYKKDDSPLTLADRVANDMICEELSSIAPEIPIISEENQQSPYHERKSWSRCWLVDPLDGTKEFVKRNGEFTVNIALIEDQQTVAGWIYVPVTEEMYVGVRGDGAWKLKDGRRTSLSVERLPQKKEGTRIICSRSHLNEPTQAFVDRYESPVLIPKGSSLKFLSIAENEADVYPRLGPTMEWDTAAAHAILEAAGGFVSQVDGTKLLYNKENLLNPHFLACSRAEYVLE